MTTDAVDDRPANSSAASKKTVVAWVCANLKATAASTRYRCYYPAAALRRMGIESVFYRSSEQVFVDLDEINAVVFVKALDAGSVALASAAKLRRIKVFIDLCDNIVVPNYAPVFDLKPVGIIAGVSAIADAVITPSPALSDALRPHLASAVRMVSIPDGIETANTVEVARKLEIEAVARLSRQNRWSPKRLWQRRRHIAGLGLKQLRRARNLIYRAPLIVASKCYRRLTGIGGSPIAADSTSGNPSRKQVLWFGNHGAPHSNFGMLALLQAGTALETVNSEFPLELHVVSDDRSTFECVQSAIKIPARFTKWNFNNTFDAFATADVCLLPFGTDAFALTKSSNRALLALAHGVPVLTSRIRSMEPLAEVVFFDDWENGLKTFLGPDGVRERTNVISRARPILDERFSADTIAKTWHDLISAPSARLRFGRIDHKIVTEIAVFLQADADLKVLLSVIDALMDDRTVQLKVMLSPSALKLGKHVFRACMERGVVPYMLLASNFESGEDRALRTIDTLLVASKNVGVLWSEAAAIIANARRLSIKTFAMQSAVDAIGLTVQKSSPQGISPFIADVVLIWNEPDTLPVWVSPEDRAKCVAIGDPSRPESAQQAANLLKTKRES